MKNYIVHDIDGKILRTGSCPDAMVVLQVGPGEHVTEGKADDVTQKIVDGEVVDKTPAEIEVEKVLPPVIPLGQQPARITNEQWDAVLARLAVLER